MTPPPSESENPPLIPPRPTSLTVVGIIGIIFGAMGVLCVGGITTFSLIKGDPTMEQAPQSMMMLNIGLVVAGVLLSMMLLIGSVGLLTLRPWSRMLMIVLAWADLIFDVAKFVICIVWLLPMMMKLFEEHPPPNVTPQTLPFVRIVSIVQWTLILVLTTGYAIFTLVVLSRPKVKDALEGQGFPTLPTM